MSASSLFAGFTFGVIGLALIRNGKKFGNIIHIAAGLILMIYPYFVESAFLLWGIGVALCAIAWLKK